METTTPSIDDFMETVASRNPRTRAHYVEVLNALENWAGCSLGELTENRLKSLMTKLRAMDSGKHYAAILRMFLTRFDMDTLAKRARIKQREKKLQPDEILTVSEVKTLIDAAGPTRNRAFIALLYECGVRVAEGCVLTRGDVKWKPPENGTPGYFVVRFWVVKERGEEHLGFLISTAPIMEAWLKIHPDPSPDAPLFPSAATGKAITRTGGWGIVSEAAHRARILGSDGKAKRVHPHTLRHSRCTHLLAGGASEAHVKVLMGWAPGSQMLARYAHLVSEDAKATAFQAAGVKAPEEVKVDVLDFQDERLRPMVPVGAFPGSVDAVPMKSPVRDAIQVFMRLMEEKPKEMQSELAAMLKAAELTARGPAATPASSG
ncbi:MAG TPA: tyrosine-type recombinase/integrase [Thermoplasmata archaeon]|nr:tyrosine-type recombinase/integrase [Thermoplasmata archaeon]